MAERKVTARLSWEGVKKFTSDIKGAGRQIDQSFEKGRRKVKQFEAQGKKASSNLQTSFSKLSGILGPLGLGLGIGAAVLGVKRLISSTIQARDEIAKFSKATDISVEFLSSMRLATERSGSSMRDLQVGLRGLLRNMQGAKDGLAESERAFNQLQIEVLEADGSLRDVEDVFIDVAEAIKNMASQTEKAALAQELFGRSGIKLVPLLDEGAEGIRKFVEEAKKLNLVFSKEEASEAEEVADAITNYNKAMKGLSETLISKFFPALTAVAGGITALLSGETFETLKRDLKGQKKGAEDAGGGWSALTRALASGKDALVELKNVTKEGIVVFTPEQLEGIRTARGELTNAAREIFMSVFGMVPALTAIEAKQINITDQTHKQKSDYIQINGELKKVPSLLELTNTQMAQAEMIAEGLKHFAFGIAQGFADAVIEGRNLLDVLKEILKQLAKKAFGAFLGAVVGALFGNPLAGAKIGAGFQRGGRAPVGRPILVGERGPEIITLDRPGTVIPAPETRRMLERSVQNIWNIQISTLRRLDNFTIITEIFPTIEREMRRRGLI